jgi:predicted DNA-binding transcriptional regulator YafY
VKKLPNITIPDIQLSAAEIIALYLIKGEEKLYRGTEIEKTINSAFQKIGMFLPEEAADQLKKIKTLFVPAAKFAKDYSGKEEIINQLTEAVLQRKTCLVTYHAFSDDRVKNFKINPLHFYERDGGLYIFVQSAAYGDVITLAVERIQSLVITPDSFEYPKSFNPESLLDSAFDMVCEDPTDFKIWFSADQARYIKERVWSKTQKIEDQADGSIVLTMRTGGMWDVKRWVLSNGAQARVLEPEELKQEIAEELRAAYNRYS